MLHELRESHGYSLRALAQAAGTSHEQVRRLEQRGLTEHSDRAIAARVAAVFGESLEDVFPGAHVLPREPSPRPGALPLGPWEPTLPRPDLEAVS